MTQYLSAMAMESRSGRDAPGWQSASLLRPALFVLTFLLAWVGVEPFTDLSDPSLVTISTAGNPLNQVAYLAIAASVFAAAALLDSRIFRLYMQPILILALVWVAVSALLSVDPSLAGRRVLYAVLVVSMASVVLILPRSMRELADMLAGLALLIIFLCFAGVALAPRLSIHQASDVVEPLLAGDWRGIFAHKNAAAAMMVVFVFIGLYVARVRSRLLGWFVAIAAGVFLVATHGKAASMLLPLVLVLSWLVLRLKSNYLRAVVVVSGLVLLNVATVGSAYSESVRKTAGLVLPDVTYTGRTEIWRLAIDHVAERPLFGYGLGAFWGTSRVIYSAETQTEQDATRASHGHNGYIDLALAAGLPGLLFGVFWVVLTPLAGLKQALEQNRPLAAFFVQIWLFGLYLSCLESVLFDRGNPIWFSMLIAVFGLRLMAMCRFKP